MADLFFSYSAKDRERVRPICEALTALGFDVFWDQDVPTGTDWDTWIKQQLNAARAAVVFWSFTSILSDNVRHEATVAKHAGKLVPIMLDPLRVDQFPMGLFNTQAARLIDWSGDGNDPEWQKLLHEIESKAMPQWIERRLALLEASLKAETRRRETAESKEDAAESQLNQEIAKLGQLRRERDRAQAETAAARAELAGLQDATARTPPAGPTVRRGVPMWIVLAGVLAAAGAGAGAGYFGQIGEVRKAQDALRQIEAREQADRDARTQAQARDRAEAERRATQAQQAAERDRAAAAERDRAAAAERERRDAEQKQQLASSGLTTVMINVTLNGRLLKTVHNLKSPEQCQLICFNESRCKGYEFRGLANFCYLFERIESLGLNTGVISGRRN